MKQVSLQVDIKQTLNIFLCRFIRETTPHFALFIISFCGRKIFGRANYKSDPKNMQFIKKLN